MFARVAPAVCLVLAAAGLGACPNPPSPIEPSKAAPVVKLDIGEPEVVAVAPAPVAPPTLFDTVALAPAEGDTTDYRAEGARYLAEGRAMEAVGALRLALSSASTPEVWQQLGEAYLGVGDDDKGVACLEESINADPARTAARRTLAKRYLAMNDGARAKEHIDELVRQDAQDASARQMLGRAFMQQKMWQQAIDAFTLVVQAEPDNIHAHNNLGFSAIQIGELELARAHLERTLSLEPQQGYMLNNLGVTYERLGRHAEAHAAFSRAAELSPRYAQAKLNRDRLQAGLSQDERIVSAETLLQLRAVPGDGVDGGEAPGADPVSAAVDAATGGGIRLAPSDRQVDGPMP
ncbi:MAG: tetratricopeptide repeat protein [Deltaproteobacteria bacterium]|nr:tetratricopeptide repeat protein [Deltaproteobacteria bacterium]